VEIKIIDKPISLPDVASLAEEQFGEMIKAAVDVKREIIALGGELHSDEEALLLETGSRQEDLWGINIYPEKPEEERVEFDSMINVRPSQNNRSRGVEDAQIQARILRVVNNLIHS